MSEHRLGSVVLALPRCADVDSDGDDYGSVNGAAADRQRTEI